MCIVSSQALKDAMYTLWNGGQAANGLQTAVIWVTWLASFFFLAKVMMGYLLAILMYPYVQFRWAGNCFVVHMRSVITPYGAAWCGYRCMLARR